MRGIADQEGGKREGEKGEIVRGAGVDRGRGPECNIKFSDGGCRPAFNVQFATDTATGLVVGVDVTNAGTDSEEMPPMLDQLEARYDAVPDEILVDGGFASLDAIDATEARRYQGLRTGEGRGEAAESGQGPIRPEAARHGPHGGLARTDGPGGIADDLQAPLPLNSRMGQCVVPQPRILADAGAWSH